ncbi:calcium-binding protein [Hoeflea sp.]|uniref:calcium-binding protein n=1 Tax=Hoeflea sp. TaxID=1940281 RepID=UPI003BAFD64C
MSTTSGYFQNSYTFTISGSTAGFEAYFAAIESNAIAAINHLSDYISWAGTLDFTVQFGSPTQFGHNGTGLLPAYGGVGDDDRTFAQSEAITGVDANGGDYDLGAYILPNSNGTLTNYGIPLNFDPSPDATEIHSPPPGTHDFFSIFLHETLHGMGFWSVAQHGPEYGQSTFDTLTEEVGGNWFFNGANVQALLGRPLPLALSGSRDHYSGTTSTLDGFPSIDRGSVFHVGNYEGNRWHLGQVELAVLADLGWTVANQSSLPVVELPDSAPNLTATAGLPSLYGDHQNNVMQGNSVANSLVGNGGADTLNGNGGNDMLYGGLGADAMDGGADFDYARYDNAASAVAVYLANDRPNSGEAAGDTFANIEGLILSAHNDYGFGDDGANYIYGQGGSDSLAGGLGADYLDGGEGFDYVRYDDAAYPDEIRVYLQSQYSNLNTGVAAIGDIFVSIEGLQTSVRNDTLFGNSENNILLGNLGTDNLYGFTGNDTLYGGAGDPNGDGVRDNFVFDQAPIAANADIVGDFERGLDQIALSTDIFGTDESRIQLNPNTSELVYTGVNGNEYSVIATLIGETVFDASDYYFY